jgi:DNA-binding NarL/FixJ family response regulator
MPLRYFIVAPDQTDRERLRRFMRDQPELEWVGEAGIGSVGLFLPRHRPPDVFFVEVSVPGFDALSLRVRLDEAAPSACVLATGQARDVLRAFDLGALDYLERPVTPARLGHALTLARRSRAGRGERR